MMIWGLKKRFVWSEKLGGRIEGERDAINSPSRKFV